METAFSTALSVLLACAAAAGAQPKGPVAKITGPTKVDVYTTVKLSAAESEGQGLAWLSFSKGISGGAVNASKEYWFTGPPGEYQIALIATQGGVIATDQIVVTIIGADPTPIPVPPGPTPPGPKPPIPIPPGPVQGLRVMFLRESSDERTKEQNHIWDSTAIRAYLNTKAAKDGWRFWDKDTTKENESEVWKGIWRAAQAMSQVPLPALFIFSDQRGEVFPLPATEAETLALLKRYGG